MQVEIASCVGHTQSLHWSDHHGRLPHLSGHLPHLSGHHGRHDHPLFHQ